MHITVKDIQELARRELTEISPDLATPEEIERQTRHLAKFMRDVKTAEAEKAKRMAQQGLTGPYRKIWENRETKVQEEIDAYDAVLEELGPDPLDDLA